MRGAEPVRSQESVRGEAAVIGTSTLGAVGLAQADTQAALPELRDFLPAVHDLDPATRRALLAAGREVRECRRVLVKAGLNVVGEVLRGQGQFVEMEHYPRDDVFDADTASQYYYHAHRGALEHGHFHTFVRADGLPATMHPLEWPLASRRWPAGKDAICHLVAISMDAWGEPIGLFATNRWVSRRSRRRDARGTIAATA